VRDHTKNHYGRVQSIDQSGVTLLKGCDGDDTELIRLEELEKVSFDDSLCAPPAREWISSPRKVPCNGPTEKMFTVYGNSDSVQFFLYAKDLVITNREKITMTVRSGQRIEGSLAKLSGLNYDDICLGRMQPETPWTGVFSVVKKYNPTKGKRSRRSAGD
jgi:hypothetical protein